MDERKTDLYRYRQEKAGTCLSSAKILAQSGDYCSAANRSGYTVSHSIRHRVFHYYMFNKPFGCVTARRDARFPTVMDYFQELGNDRLSPVGRLDRETEGLLIITDDGKWNQRMTHPKHQKKKTYEFTVLGELDAERLYKLENGILLNGSDTPTLPCKITVTGRSVLSETLPLLHPEVQASVERNRPDHPVTMGIITITEGRKRQIRRMMKAVHCCVVVLRRIAIDQIVLDENLKPGQWKEVTLNDI